jgi:hypothetical protein
MKKLFLLLSLSVLIPQFVRSQNLVRNPSFDTMIQCPSGSGAFVNYIDVWTKPSYGSPDYFVVGCPVAPSDEPPRTGNAETGIICYDPANIREYMTGHLSSPLLAGTTYTVSYYVSLNNSSMKGITELGAYLTSTNINNANANPIIVTPQVQGTMPYTDTASWQLVQGSFVASGGEQYIIIGSFVPDSVMTFTNVSSVGWGDVYYFVDDVCVTEGTQGCTPLGMPDMKNPEYVSVFPNPSLGNTTLAFENSAKENFTLLVYNCNGELVFARNHISESKAQIERGDLPAGLYFYQLHSATRSLAGKFNWK